MTLRLNKLEDLGDFASDDTLELNNVPRTKRGSSPPVSRPQRSTSARSRHKASHLEQHFLTLWEQAGYLSFQREYRFHPRRGWRFDFAWPDQMVAVEIEGINPRGKSRHRTARGFRKDLDKYFAATMLGWTLFRLSGDMITPRRLRIIQEFLLNRS